MPKRAGKSAKSEARRLAATDQRIGINTTPDQAYELAQRLASDDKFRARLENNPRQELAKYNIDLPPGRTPTNIKLPAKSALRSTLRKITVGAEFKTEETALAAALSYAWFHVVFSGYRFGVVLASKTKKTSRKK